MMSATYYCGDALLLTTSVQRETSQFGFGHLGCGVRYALARKDPYDGCPAIEVVLLRAALLGSSEKAFGVRAQREPLDLYFMEADKRMRKTTSSMRCQEGCRSP